MPNADSIPGVYGCTCCAPGAIASAWLWSLYDLHMGEGVISDRMHDNTEPAKNVRGCPLAGNFHQCPSAREDLAAM